MRFEEQTVDEREQAEWFQRLPDHAQDDMRVLWDVREGRTAEQLERRRRTTNRYRLEGMGLFILVGWMFYPLTFPGLMLAIVIGGGVGALAALRRACAYEYPLIASVGQVTFSLVYVGWINIFPFMFCTALGVWLGAAHALNRTDFTES